MKTTRNFFAASAIFAISSVAGFASEADWESSSPNEGNAWTADSGFFEIVPEQKTWCLSFGPFAALTADEYVEGYKDTRVNVFGAQFLLSKTFAGANSPVGFDLGLLGCLGYGVSEWDDYRENELSQWDFMLGPQFGIRLNPSNKGVSIGFGVQVGIDYRNIEYTEKRKYSSYKYEDLEDDEVGAFYGVYWDLRTPLSDSWALSITYRYMGTNVDFKGEGEGVEDSIGYHMISLCATFAW